MEQDIRPMMPPRLESVELTIQHVRQEGEGMPVIDRNSAEGPLNSISGQARGDPRILVNVIIVVVVDEVMPQGLAKDDPDDQREEKRDDSDSGDNVIGPGRRLRRGCLLLYCTLFRLAPMPHGFRIADCGRELAGRATVLGDW